MTFQWEEQKILVVEDVVELLDIFSEVFEVCGAQVFRAENGIKALEILDSHDITFVVSDVQMPKMDGIEMLKSIRTRDPDVPLVLLVTGQAGLNQAEAIALGASGMIYKPIGSKILTGTVQKIIEERMSSNSPA